jgi:hypothetical protein
MDEPDRGTHAWRDGFHGNKNLFYYLLLPLMGSFHQRYLTAREDSVTPHHGEATKGLRASLSYLMYHLCQQQDVYGLLPGISVLPRISLRLC